MLPETYIGAIASIVFFGAFILALAWAWWYTRASRPRFPTVEEVGRK